MNEPVNFGAAKTGEYAYVWVCPPGHEYSFVSDPEYFEDEDEATTITRQTWLLINEQEVTFHPRHELCPACQGEGTHPMSDAISCGSCHGDGRHPDAGTMTVASRAQNVEEPT